MKRSGRREYIAILLYFSLLSGRGYSRPSHISVADCTIENQNCANDFQKFYTNYLVVGFISVGLLMVPMVFCCYLSKAKADQQEPPHIYEDIDKEIALSQAKCTSETVAKSSAPLCRKNEKSPEDEAPQLPDREYLTDIEFVAQEFDLILCRPPEIPDRPDPLSSSNNLLVVGGVPESNIIAALKQSDTTKSDGKPVGYQHKCGQRAVIKSARPNQYNLTGPVKHNVNPTSYSQKPSQNSLQSRQMVHQMPMVDREATKMLRSVSPSVREDIGDKMPFGSTHSLRQARSNDSRVISSQSPTNSRTLPYRQSVTSKQAASHLSEEKSHTKNTCPTYQNFLEVRSLQPSQTEETYDNVTEEGLQYCEHDSRVIPGPVTEQQPADSLYQPLLFGPDADEDEYIEVDMF